MLKEKNLKRSTVDTIITNYWRRQFFGKIVYQAPRLKLMVKDDLEEDEQLMTLVLPEGNKQIVINRQLMNSLETEDLRQYDFDKIIDFFEQIGVFLHGGDYLFYVDEEQQTVLKELAIPSNIRVLTAADAVHFSAFEQAATPNDWDDASVALDHWLVYGAFEDGKLVAVASMYPWNDEFQIADIGVLTRSEYRSKGYAYLVVQAAAQAALKMGYQPQYRCQLDNGASIALAKKLKLTLFGEWNIVTPSVTGEDNTVMRTVTSFAHELIRMADEDLFARERLMAEGKLSGGYHPEMEAVHRTNAARLRQIIKTIGYPSISKVGAKASDDAWLIVQHAIGEPDFMLDCYEKMLSCRDDLNPANIAYLYDRIQVFKEKPQRYGTQFLEGGIIYPVEDKERLNVERARMNLPALTAQEIKAIAAIDQIDALNQDEGYVVWKKKVGWI
ncbi:MAG: GNAT family N-acetyltransferase [Sphingobacterium sp.]|jgi:RimJ/RimL family protein N-acetyltransferase|nr:GNAT family N-acetyltransferase [Sphingobacterium sp.]